MVMESAAEAERIRALILLRSVCDTALARLDEGDIDDLSVVVAVGELQAAIDGHMAATARRFAERQTPAS
jgi:hypothetical protein